MMDFNNRTLRFQPRLDKGKAYNKSDKVRVVNLNEANILCSDSPDNPDLHYPVIDIDVPCQLIQSTTQGHYHLYIDKSVSGDLYFKMLEAMARAGIVEEGYANVSKSRGFSAVRLPWVKKEDSSAKQDVPLWCEAWT